VRKRSANLNFIIGAVVAVAVIGVYLWYRAGLMPVDMGDHEAISVTITEGSSLDQTAQQLKSDGVIRSKGSFIIFVLLHGLHSKLQAGTYTLSPADPAVNIADIISHGKVTTNSLVVPEGSTIAQITAEAAKHGIPADAFNSALNDQYNETFLASRPAGVSLEGYLFPDTYSVTKATTAHALISEMLTNFDQKVGLSFQSAFTAEGLTPHQGLTLASIVEKETSTPADQAIVAQVYLLRLKDGMNLDADPTYIYGASLLDTPADTHVNSPYNTYLNKGLPPGPICSPGVSAIRAAAHPSSTDFLYFIADKNGMMHYAHTYAEHQTNVAKYLGQ
jgi:UPF0755 protein